jgi:hypothetical protein
MSFTKSIVMAALVLFSFNSFGKRNCTEILDDSISRLKKKTDTLIEDYEADKPLSRNSDFMRTRGGNSRVNLAKRSALRVRALGQDCQDELLKRSSTYIENNNIYENGIEPEALSTTTAWLLLVSTLIELVEEEENYDKVMHPRLSQAYTSLRNINSLDIEVHYLNFINQEIDHYCYYISKEDCSLNIEFERENN